MARRVLVVGGGPAGMEAAWRLRCWGFEVLLVEKEKELGGRVKHFSLLFPSLERAERFLEEKKAQVTEARVTVYTETELAAVEENSSGIRARLAVRSGGEEEIEADALLLAVGLDYFDLRAYGEYGYGLYPGVIASWELEQYLRSGEVVSLVGKKEKPVIAFIQCVGSRDRAKGQSYCSRICCMYTGKQAAQMRELFPEARIYVFYMDVRAAGRGYEEFIRYVIEEKDVNYIRSRPSRVFSYRGRLWLRFEDTLMGTPGEMDVDLVVLAGALVPRADIVEMGRKIGLAVDEDGFLIAAEKAYPLKAGERVFFAGACGFPVSAEEAVLQGAAAAAEVAVALGGSC